MNCAIFHIVNEYLKQKEVTMKIIIAYATNSAVYMIVRYWTFTAFLKQSFSQVIEIHSIIHRKYLVHKNITP